jgi:hypothetical protein
LEYQSLLSETGQSIGFCNADKKVLTIPAEERISLAPARAPVVVYDALWDDRPVFAFREDVERNAIVAIQKGQLSDFIGRT